MVSSKETSPAGYLASLPPERRKVWTACDEHRADLESFLRSRGFLRDTVPMEDLP